jgi:Ca2+:H+ antiporter
LSLALLVAALVAGVGTLLAVLCSAALVGAIIVAVHHAEVVAHRVGEPFGTLVLALAVTVIETALILSMMIAGGDDMAVLPRDAIYAAVMIICNGVVGICVLAGGLAHREQTFRAEGAGAGLAALIVMSTLTLVLPVFTTSTPAGTYSSPQLAFVAVSSAALWASFIFVQTVRHRDYFIPVTGAADLDVHAEPPTAREAWVSFGLLLVSLVAIVGLAKMLSPTIEGAVEAADAPRAVVGIVVAGLILLPEGWAAVRCCPRESTSEKHQSSDRLRARMHWSHRPSCGAGFDRLPVAPGLGPGAHGHWDARDDVPGERRHSRHRSHLRDAGGSASGALCSVPVPRVRALSSGSR